MLLLCPSERCLCLGRALKKNKNGDFVLRRGRSTFQRLACFFFLSFFVLFFLVLVNSGGRARDLFSVWFEIEAEAEKGCSCEMDGGGKKRKGKMEEESEAKGRYKNSNRP